VNRRKPRVQTLIVSRYPAPAPVHNFILLFLPPCGPHFTPLATGSLEPSLLVSPLLGGPVKPGPFALALHPHQRKSSRKLHLQYSAKSQSTPHCQSLITAGSDHPPVLRRFGPQLANAKWFSSLKLNSGCHRIRLKSREENKTAFQTHFGLFEFRVMEFGLCGTPGTFQGATNCTLSPLLRKCVFVFFDDILVYKCYLF
jgi:hypothetical protein